MPLKDRLDTLFGPFQLLWVSLWIHSVALKDALLKDGIKALACPQRIRDAAVAKLLILASENFISYEDTTPVPSLVSYASGTILELGPGPGNQIHRFDRSLVKFIYGIDPNPNFERDIAARLEKHNLQDKYQFLACGLEDSHVLREAGITEGSMDTVLSIQVVCSVGDPMSLMREAYSLLRPGGRFIFWEHGRSDDAFTALAQACWNPAWSALVGGCCINRDIKSAIVAAGEWESLDAIEQDEDPYNFLPRTWGVLVKKV
ncbi:hypothetical protein QQS21_004999 [Conoideocrella luteorostrata]|uniref:Methyltransferase type 11 domain-containing protein n=1 Tax=Conoideocrella luteorostrata TaxID=1105319 RepID=A0AAJ0CQA3_9HYPO|nr:hypothetical protein QQS21_004999 [Conoideocrella luteorostrata]